MATSYAKRTSDARAASCFGSVRDDSTPGTSSVTAIRRTILYYVISIEH